MRVMFQAVEGKIGEMIGTSRSINWFDVIAGSVVLLILWCPCALFIKTHGWWTFVSLCPFHRP